MAGMAEAAAGAVRGDPAAPLSWWSYPRVLLGLKMMMVVLYCLTLSLPRPVSSYQVQLWKGRRGRRREGGGKEEGRRREGGGKEEVRIRVMVRVGVRVRVRVRVKVRVKVRVRVRVKGKG